ncbi:MAG: hypothetical protein A2277_20815 [Desulfobacterales bacterium RIFOXYA12_FULL_46_15]|nr:MAG: hypothetical protein A2277_20815 [Desulfobacterales bacterium RIFOXYA12_FULL_46_15]
MAITVAILIVAIIGFLFFIKKQKPVSEGIAAPDPVSQPGPSPDQEYGAILDSLLKLNIIMRKDKDFPDEMTGEIETIIDDLMVVTPAMMEQYPGETLTYEIKKIGKTHLFKTVKEYLDLSPESRKAQFDIFKKTIESLREVSNRSRDIVEKNETAEFKTMANFLAGKFS